MLCFVISRLFHSERTLISFFRCDVIHTNPTFTLCENMLRNGQPLNQLVCLHYYPYFAAASAQTATKLEVSQFLRFVFAKRNASLLRTHSMFLLFGIGFDPFYSQVPRSQIDFHLHHHVWDHYFLPQHLHHSQIVHISGSWATHFFRTTPWMRPTWWFFCTSSSTGTVLHVAYHRSSPPSKPIWTTARTQARHVPTLLWTSQQLPCYFGRTKILSPFHTLRVTYCVPAGSVLFFTDVTLPSITFVDSFKDAKKSFALSNLSWLSCGKQWVRSEKQYIVQLRAVRKRQHAPHLQFEMCPHLPQHRLPPWRVSSFGWLSRTRKTCNLREIILGSRVLVSHMEDEDDQENEKEDEREDGKQRVKGRRDWSNTQHERMDGMKWSARHTLFLSLEPCQCLDPCQCDIKGVVDQRENVTCEVCCSHPVGCSRLLLAVNDLTTTMSKKSSNCHSEQLSEEAS